MIIQSSATRRSRPSAVAADYQLAVGHYIPKKQAMIRVFPRPDNETNVWAAHRRHYPGIPLRHPVSVAFGARPLWYEMITGPSGMTVGAGWDDWDNWGVVSWTNPTTGNHSVTVRVHDQEENTLDISWTLEVTTSGALFIDPVSGNNANPGTLASPLASNSGWHNNSSSDATYAGYQLYFKATTHALDGFGSGNQGSPYVPLNSNKPLVYKPWDGQYILDMSTGIFESTVGSASPDMFIGGGKFQNNIQTVSDGRVFFIYGASTTRVTMFENEFYNIGAGINGYDNASCAFITTSTQKDYFVISGNTYDTLAGSTNGVSAYDMYWCNNVVIEKNLGRNLDSRYWLWPKSGNGNTTIAHNIAIDNIATTGGPTGVIGANITAGGSASGLNNMEVCWNKLVNDSADESARGYTISFDETGHSSESGLKYWAYRNTVFGNIAEEDSNTVDSTTAVENNLIVLNVGETNAIVGSWPVNSNNVTLVAGDFDANKDLTGSARTTYLGTHGSEID